MGPVEMLAHACMLARCHDEHVEHANKSKHAGFINPTRQMSGIKRNILSKKNNSREVKKHVRRIERKDSSVRCVRLACLRAFYKETRPDKEYSFSQKLVKINQFEPRGPFLSLDRKKKEENKEIDMETRPCVEMRETDANRYSLKQDRYANIKQNRGKNKMPRQMVWYWLDAIPYAFIASKRNEKVFFRFRVAVKICSSVNATRPFRKGVY